MTDADPAVDADLVECLVVVVPGPGSVAGVAHAMGAMVEAGTIRVIDVVVLSREDGQDVVEQVDLGTARHMAVLADLGDGVPEMFSAGDIELASAAVPPGSIAVMFLVEGRWAAPLASATRQVGGLVVGGERIARSRVEAAVAGWGSGRGYASRDAVGDLLSVVPGDGRGAESGFTIGINPAQQLKELAELIGRGLLSAEEYERQRRKVLDL